MRWSVVQQLTERRERQGERREGERRERETLVALSSARLGRGHTHRPCIEIAHGMHHHQQQRLTVDRRHCLGAMPSSHAVIPSRKCRRTGQLMENVGDSISARRESLAKRKECARSDISQCHISVVSSTLFNDFSIFWPNVNIPSDPHVRRSCPPYQSRCPKEIIFRRPQKREACNHDMQCNVPRPADMDTPAFPQFRFFCFGVGVTAVSRPSRISWPNT
jgi:hypothetical protein